MKRRGPVDIFSFSFLDVIACGVGVILFITLLVMMQAVQSMDSASRKAYDEVMSFESTIDRMEKEVKQWEEDAPKWAKISDENAQVQKRLEEVNREVQARQEAQRTARDASAGYAEIAKMDNEIAAIEGVQRVIAARKPAVRETHKKNRLFMAFPGRGFVRIFERIDDFNFKSEHYRVSDSLLSTQFAAKNDGVKVAEALKEGGMLAQYMRKLNPNTDYVECYVEKDGFEEFVYVREALYANGWEVGFFFIPDTSRLVFGMGGASAPVQ